MGSEVIPVRLPRDLKEAIDRMVEQGIFKSRSEAIRQLAREGLRSYEKTSQILKIAEKLRRWEEKEGKPVLLLEGALRELLEERRRR